MQQSLLGDPHNHDDQRLTCRYKYRIHVRACLCSTRYRMRNKSVIHRIFLAHGLCHHQNQLCAARLLLLLQRHVPVYEVFLTHIQRRPVRAKIALKTTHQNVYRKYQVPAVDLLTALHMQLREMLRGGYLLEDS